MPSRHTTLRLSEPLMKKARAYARQHDLTLTTVMERALAEYLAHGRDRPAGAPVELPAFGRGGPQPGVNLDDTSALIDRMDGIE